MRALPKRPVKSESSGGWIVTFADLMSLLLTFFILLLSFSKLDLARYELMARSLAAAFGSAGGSQGGSIIFEEKPAPAQPDAPVPEPSSQVPSAPPEASEIDMLEEVSGLDRVKQLDPNIERLTETLVQRLESEILSNALAVNYDADKVVVRFSEATTFPSGSEQLKLEMLPILEKVEDVLAECKGEIIVSGYTDDLPVRSSRFRSNWDLSAARAVSVVHQLVLNQKIDANTVSAAGRAETNPLVPNDTPENRGRNRRVEISIFNPQCDGKELLF